MIPGPQSFEQYEQAHSLPLNTLNDCLAYWRATKTFPHKAWKDIDARDRTETTVKDNPPKA